MSILVSHGDKGGVGKSLVLSAYVDHRMNMEGFDPAKFVVLDADPRNADVFRMFDGYLTAERINLSSKEGWMRFVDRIQDEAGRDYEYVLSLPAGIGAILAQEGEKFGDYMGHLGHDITMLWTIDRMPDSINLLKRAMFDMGQKLKKIVVVKNQFFGAGDSFSRWDNSYLRKLFLAQGGVEGNFPELHEWVIDQVIGNPLDEADVRQLLAKQNIIGADEAALVEAHRTVPFSVLLERKDLRLTLRGELEDWLRQVDKFFASINIAPQPKKGKK